MVYRARGGWCVTALQQSGDHGQVGSRGVVSTVQPGEQGSTSQPRMEQLLCPLAHLCLNGARCQTRTLLVCERHATPLYICPIKNRGRTCPVCGAWIEGLVHVLAPAMQPDEPW
jgi:hypothetical protein